MKYTISHRWRALAAMTIFGALFTLPAIADKIPQGQAKGVHASINNSTMDISDSGTLDGVGDPRDTGVVVGAIPEVLTGETLVSSTIGWSGEVTSQTSLTDLAVNVSGTDVAADVVMSQAIAQASGKNTGSTTLEGLRIGGTPVAFDGSRNQKLSMGNLDVVLNEQFHQGNEMVVNALHIKSMDGTEDLVIGSSSASLSN